MINASVEAWLDFERRLLSIQSVAKAPWMLGPHDSVGPTKSRNLGSRNMLPCQGMGSGGAEETGPWNQEVLRTAHSRLKQEGPEAGSSWQAPEGLAGHV